MKHDVRADVDAVGRIGAVATILNVVCGTTGMGFAAVARVTEDQWVACGVRDTIGFGLAPGDELRVETTICNEIRQHRQVVVIDDAQSDPVWRAHPTPTMYGIRSYISVPIVLPDGTFFGTLCAVDPAPRRLDTPEVLASFGLFAELIAFHLDAQARLALARSRLLAANEREVLRDQFIAVLGHDLRNPLASIESGTRVLRRIGLPEAAQPVLDRMEYSVGRMERLIGDVLDFARGRLGGGLELSRRDGSALLETLIQVVAEHRASAPERVLEAEVALTEPVQCDPVRIGQLLSNLLGNALTHGDPMAPVRVRAVTDNGNFLLSVSNAGAQIPPAALERLFQPFFRGDPANRQGLGLGLYIASEIARVHGGTLGVDSTTAETRFTLRMPVG